MRRARVYIFEPAGWDLLDPKPHVRKYAGQEVQKVQPAGCPRNGTMRHCFVQTLDGDFVGLVAEASLKRTGRTAPVRDKAAEAREARGRAIMDSIHRRSR